MIHSIHFYASHVYFDTSETFLYSLQKSATRPEAGNDFLFFPNFNESWGNIEMLENPGEAPIYTHSVITSNICFYFYF
jgi:hypothetical protein